VALNSHWKWHVSLDALIIISSRIRYWWITSVSRMSRGGTSGRSVFAGGNIFCNCVAREKKKYVYLVCEVGEAKGVKTQVGLLMTTWSFILLESNLYQRLLRQFPSHGDRIQNVVECRLLVPVPSFCTANDRFDDCTVLLSLVASAVIV